MAVSKAKKTEILEELKTLLQNSKSVWFTSNTGLSVEDITALRVSLREVDSTITLAKKTLIKIAFKEVYDLELSDDLLPGQIAMVCSNEDAIAGLGKVNGFMKKGQPGADKIEWTWAYLEWEIQDAEATKKLAGMPSRETLLGRLVGSMQSPLSGLARFFDAAAKDLESQGKAKVWELEGEPKAEETAKEETKTEEKKEEVAEAPKGEVKAEEAPAETPREEASAEAVEEAPAEEAKTEEK
jgi:large subunit ribosomal protein L10